MALLAPETKMPARGGREKGPQMRAMSVNQIRDSLGIGGRVLGTAFARRSIGTTDDRYGLLPHSLRAAESIQMNFLSI